MESNNLLACMASVFDVISYLHGLKTSQEDKETDYKDVRQAVQDAIIEFEKKSLANQLPFEAVQQAKYAAVAFIDEFVILNLQPFSHQWLAFPLQLEFFGENIAGERFFSQLDRLRMQGQKSIDVLEIYYLLLNLGYEGKYRIQEKTKLIALKTELLQQILSTRQCMPSSLFVSSQRTPPPKEIGMQHSSKMRLWLLRGSIACICLAVTLALTISYQARQYKKAIERYQLQWILTQEN